MSLASALELIDAVADMRVLFIGDTIIDEYCYVAPMGKSPKENLIPVRFKSRETFDGGVDAAAKHARSFCREVVIGSSGPATRKVRMVDENYLRKLFEVHYQDGRGGRPWPQGGDFDCIAIADFGHGEIVDPHGFDRSEVFVALAVQTNSANVGFNLVTKYARADYIVIDEPEARLAARDREGHIEDVLVALANGRADKFVITLGKRGAIGYESGRIYTSGPVGDESPVDTMGAGDAFFAVTAPMAKYGRMEDLLLIGNAAGALKCQVVGHRKSVEKAELVEFMRAHC